ncbi:DUF3467 domain-containing protein [Terrarubrum flagellatum]|uniref:DUF3467 domain-containing protein n=1 Tax=Terrirubrum flagellatum TaxID=2895980 RepID=UPI003144F595
MSDLSTPDMRPDEAAQLANGAKSAQPIHELKPSLPKVDAFKSDALKALADSVKPTASSPAKPSRAEASKPADALRPSAPQEGQGKKLRIDASELTSSYCNVCNASSTREEVVLNFGVNHDWDRGAAGADVKMLHRIILSPFAAKRVSQLLASLLREYEARHGELK